MSKNEKYEKKMPDLESGQIIKINLEELGGHFARVHTVSGDDLYLQRIINGEVTGNPIPVKNYKQYNYWLQEN